MTLRRHGISAVIASPGTGAGVNSAKQSRRNGHGLLLWIATAQKRLAMTFGRVRKDPVSAAHRFALHCARDDANGRRKQG